MVNPQESREISINIIAGTTPISFRSILSSKNVGNMPVSNDVKLFCPEGFKVTTANKLGSPFKSVTSIVDKVSSASKATKALSLLTAGAKYLENQSENTLWAPWLNNIKSFENSGPITLTFTVKFHMGEFGLWDAQEEVLFPILNLMGLFLPRGINGVNINAHLRTTTKMLWDFIKALPDGSEFTKIFAPFSSSNENSGLDAMSAAQSSRGSGMDNLNQSIPEKLDATINNLTTSMGKMVFNSITDSTRGYNYFVNIGYSNSKFRFTRMQPTDCTVEFSNKEYDDRGYPAVGSITMTFESMQPGTLKGISTVGSKQTSIDFGFSEGSVGLQI